MKAIVFGTIFNKTAYKNLINYIGKNEPTGEISENIIFVKQNLINESKTNESYYLSYQFDDDGKVVVGNQSKYSKFTTWFYNSAGKLIKSTYTSVETIIMGVSVITLGKEKFDGEEIMEDFHKI